MPWRIVCTCGSLSGLTAAARAGMGVLVQPRSMAPAGLREIGKGKLPVLEDVEFVLVPRKGADQALVSALSDDILAKVKPAVELNWQCDGNVRADAETLTRCLHLSRSAGYLAV
jgi:DNA-binding transcriptional LysR family regulator